MNIQEFRSSRTAILTAITPQLTSQEDQAKFSLDPVDKNITVQAVRITTPRLGHDEQLTTETYAPRLEVDLLTVMFSLWGELNRTVPQGKTEDSFWTCKDWIPAVFEVDYVAKGARYTVRELYEIHYVAIALEGGQRYGIGAPQITHILYARHLDKSESSDHVIESIMKARHCKWT